MDLEDEGVQILVADDGKGFDPEKQAITAGDHFGLSIMEARAARLGGNLAIHSRPGQGTEVILTWKPNERSELVEPQEVIL
jgi:two-component system nitrate/nitrite sensor histidine kinase NarX